MAYITIDLPPGVLRTGSDYAAKGRFLTTNLWRWFAGTSMPVGGWVRHSTSAVTGKGRALHAWRDDLGLPWVACGTESHLYVMTRDGDVFDITPAGFTAGRADATTGAGYGAGVYGSDVYGTPRASTYSVLPASVWSLDNYGQDLVGVMAEDGDVCLWELDTAAGAVGLSGAPSATSLVVTAEHIIMAFGCDGNPRLIRWCDIDDPTDWTESVANHARRQVLQTTGAIVAGVKVNGGTLVFTDTDVWLASFIGRPSVYGFERRGTDCGLLSVNAAVGAQASVFWMSQSGFWAYDGYARPIACDVQDCVFSDINDVQASKVFAVHISQFGEVWWFYCSATATEIDRYVIYNYREGHWAVGQLARLAGIDRGALSYPLMTGADGFIFDHENGLAHDGVKPFARTGPVEIGQGDHVFSVRKIVPDEKTLGDVTLSFGARFFPMGAETVHGPYAMAANSDARFTARQVEITFTAAYSETDFRVGTFRLEGTAGGLR